MEEGHRHELEGWLEGTGGDEPALWGLGRGIQEELAILGCRLHC